MEIKELLTSFFQEGEVGMTTTASPAEAVAHITQVVQPVLRLREQGPG